MHKKSILLIAGMSIAALAPAYAADIRTQAISATCLSCHGPNGKSGGAIPSLAGLEQGYFVQAMKDFKSGARPASVMKKHASGYTDEEFAAMGAYFASMK